jgi:hypothetical protein
MEDLRYKNGMSSNKINKHLGKSRHVLMVYAVVIFTFQCETLKWKIKISVLRKFLKFNKDEFLKHYV